MVGNDMKRFAEKNGLTVNFKMAYGVYKGYVISLMDRDASRSLTISIRLKDERALRALNERGGKEPVLDFRGHGNREQM